MFNEDTKQNLQNLGTKNVETREPPLWQQYSLTGSQCEEKKHSIMMEHNG